MHYKSTCWYGEVAIIVPKTELFFPKGMELGTKPVVSEQFMQLLPICRSGYLSN